MCDNSEERILINHSINTLKLYTYKLFDILTTFCTRILTKNLYKDYF